jgi:kynureninase
MSDPLLRFREEFPILAHTTYLVSHSLGAMPRGVPDRLATYADTWADRGVRAWADGWWGMPIDVGNEIAPLVGAGPGEIVMVPTVTFAHAVVLSALDFSGGRDTIVMTALDFPSVRYVCEQLAPRLGARVVVVSSDDGISIDPARLFAAIDERTKLVAVSHVLFRSAYIQDADAICRRARVMGALVMLDAFHSVGVIPVDVTRSGVDFFAGGVLKWLCGGPGGCFLYVAPAVRDQLAPALTGWQAHASPFAFSTSMDYATGASRWLGGTPVVPALYAAIEGPRLLRTAGIAAVRDKSMRQTSALITLASERGYTVHAPRDPARRGGTVALGVPHGDEVSQYLLARDVLVDYRPGAGIRIAPHFYTRDEELDVALGTIDEAISTDRWREYRARVATAT